MPLSGYYPVSFIGCTSIHAVSRTLQGRSLEVHCVCNRWLHQNLPLICPRRMLLANDNMEVRVENKAEGLPVIPSGPKRTPS